MNVFEAYDKHVRKDMMPKQPDNPDDKLFELNEPEEREANDTKQEDDKPAGAVQFKLSDDDRQSIVKELAELLKGGESNGD